MNRATFIVYKLMTDVWNIKMHAEGAFYVSYTDVDTWKEWLDDLVKEWSEDYDQDWYPVLTTDAYNDIDWDIITKKYYESFIIHYNMYNK